MNKTSDQPPATPTKRPFPNMLTFEDADAAYTRSGDPFYLVAFVIQIWLSGLAMDAVSEYSEKKNPRDRTSQSGRAWTAFLSYFPSSEKRGRVCLLHYLFRFCCSDDSPGNSLRRAMIPLSLELQWLQNDPSPSAAPGPQPPAPCALPPADLIARWCQWLDSIIHLHTYRRWHTTPAAFQPDPESRLLAMLGTAQRALPSLDPRAQACWLADFSAAVDRFKDSPKWLTLGQAMSDTSDRYWPYPAVDTLVISLWPLVTRYNWTYRDLLNVIRPALKRPTAYPCDREQNLATYCNNVLGLRKPTHARNRTSPNSRPPGFEIAHRYCPSLVPPG